MVNLIRKFLWKILGSRYYEFLKNQKYVYLRDLSFVKIGEASYDNGAIVWRWAKTSELIIGKYCSVAHGVQFFLDSGFHDYKKVTTYPLFSELYKHEPPDYKINGRKPKSAYFQELTNKSSIELKNDIWIGSNALIMPGVTIHDGAVILPGSIVIKDVGAYEIHGGTPARMVDKRFDDETISQLQEMKWWDWDSSLIKERLADFYDSPATFIKKYHN
jgi:virginiamycin A acetyltransferase